MNQDCATVLSGGTKGIKHPATAMYDRISRPGKATEHTLYAFPKGILKDIEKKGYDMAMPEDYPGKFKFADTGEIAEYQGYPDATVLKPGGDGGKNGFGGVRATFKYNASDRKYYRWTYGNPHTDELNGQQVAVTNVISSTVTAMCWTPRTICISRLSPTAMNVKYSPMARRSTATGRIRESWELRPAIMMKTIRKLY